METIQERISTSKIKTSFETMDFYESNIEPIEDALIFLRENEDIFKDKISTENVELKNLCNTSNEVLITVSTNYCSLPIINPAKISSFDRTCNILKIADEIEKKKSVICQLEMCLRGISPKETMKSLIFLADSLRYYSGLTYTNLNIPVECFYLSFYGETALEVLAYILGPALSQDEKHINIFCEPIVVPLLTFIGKILLRQGFNEPVIKIVSKEKPKINKPLNRLLTQGNSPMVILSNADLDSAVESVINSTWGNHGLLPWSLSTILIQEEIFEKLVGKMKYKLQNLKMGFANDKSAHINYPVRVEGYQAKLKNLIKEAKSIGIDVFPEDSKSFEPTLFIGGFVQDSFFKSEDLAIPILTLVAFRHKAEAVTLANKFSSGLAATIWSENMELSNYIAERLNVQHIWINSHVHLEPNIPLLPLKKKEELYFVRVSDKQLVDSAKKTQQIWESFSYKTRCQKLRIVAMELKKPDKDIWIEALIKMSSQNFQKNYIGENYEVKYLEKRLGIPISPITFEINERFIEDVIRAVMDGHFVYLPVPQITEIMQEIETYLPIKAFSAFPHNEVETLCINNKYVWLPRKH